MLKVINRYLPKNKALSRLGRKARLELVLNGGVSERTTDEMRWSISCWNCKWYIFDKKALGQSFYTCTKSGTKTKKNNLELLVQLGIKKDEPSGIRMIPYCDGFEEKKEE
jgi:hypothetical protein